MLYNHYATGKLYDSVYILLGVASVRCWLIVVCLIISTEQDCCFLLQIVSTVKFSNTETLNLKDESI